MQLRKVVNHGNIRWRVTTRLNGKRKQRFFESREGARGWIKLLNADDASGGFWGQRTVAERDEIISAFNASRERQVPLLEAILDWQPLVPAKPDKHRRTHRNNGSQNQKNGQRFPLGNFQSYRVSYESKIRHYGHRKIKIP